MIIDVIQSICPVCHRPLGAKYETWPESEGVYIVMECPEHGLFETLAAEDALDFIDWVAHPVVNVPPEKFQTRGISSKDEALSPAGIADSQCPLHCGLCENHRQTACCVLIELTSRCNQRCPFCFAVAGEDDSCDNADISFEEVLRKLDLLLELGEERPFNLQLSGGEPTVREDLPEIIKAAREKGFQYIQINSNGVRLAEEEGYAEKLKEAGASVIFMQFDGTRPEIYETTRGRRLLDTKLDAIEACRRARLPVSLVPTVVKGINDDNLGDMVRFMLDNLDVVKGIHFQPASFFGRVPEGSSENRITMFGVMRGIEKQTGGLIRYEDLCPISTGHTLCCFTGAFLKERDGAVKSLLSEEQREKGMDCCDEQNPLEIISRDRDFVLNQWQLAEESAGDGFAEKASDDIMNLDDFISYYRGNSFTISGMAFMDMSNLDAERLKRCRVQVLAPDDRLIPFCAYNTLYR